MDKVDVFFNLVLAHSSFSCQGIALLTNRKDWRSVTLFLWFFFRCLNNAEDISKRTLSDCDHLTAVDILGQMGTLQRE